MSDIQIAERPKVESGEAGPHGIVLGNEKGGTGKSTIAMHLIVALVKLGFKVGSIDTDAHQGTLTHYLENRRAFLERAGVDLGLPRHIEVARAEEGDTIEARHADEAARFKAAWASLADCHYVVIDTPGSDSHLTRLGHDFADTLITPINDSYLDIDVIVRIDLHVKEVLGPSVYTRMVWEQNNRRIIEGKPAIDWIVMRNRLTHIEARNKRDITDLLGRLSRRIGFRVAAGFGERVVFRELFQKGLTLIDLPTLPKQPREPSSSHLAARQEILSLLETMGIALQQQASA